MEKTAVFTIAKSAINTPTPKNKKPRKRKKIAAFTFLESATDIPIPKNK